MLDYDHEATRYDATRGGEPRAEAAAAAVERLLPPGARTVLDLACGTGIVTRRLRRPGRTVIGVDRSPGMLAAAAQRLPGGLVRADATRLPLVRGSVDAVVTVWLLHLLPDPLPVLAEAARVLHPGGVLVTTVDKDDAYFAEDSDLARLTGPLRLRYASRLPDHAPLLIERAAGLGLRPGDETVFPGTGQGRSPRGLSAAIDRGHVPCCNHASPEEVAEVRRRLAALPDQETPRPDPLYRLIALRR
ncbi:class I SAM-dependent methyltransferase [Kitasatospora terrestris]|uniref:Class I SAM-dependent methyltransferase n=1 Tax=Kitasatospora terrestris TaxID=258051 RepID=A0ABP9EPS4_9ACTN